MFYHHSKVVPSFMYIRITQVNVSPVKATRPVHSVNHGRKAHHHFFTLGNKLPERKGEKLKP